MDYEPETTEVRGDGECVAPTALGIALGPAPAFTRWANLCRASGAAGRAGRDSDELVGLGNMQRARAKDGVGVG